MHEVVHRVPVIVVANFAVQVSEVGPVEDGALLLDQLEEEGVLGALEADGTKGRKPKEKFGESEKNRSVFFGGKCFVLQSIVKF